MSPSFVVESNFACMIFFQKFLKILMLKENFYSKEQSSVLKYAKTIFVCLLQRGSKNPIPIRMHSISLKSERFFAVVQLISLSREI